MIRLKLMSVPVDVQARALDFYTRVLGFSVKRDSPVGRDRWLTVVTADDPEGMELLLEPMGVPEARAYQKARYDAGIPIAAFGVDSIDDEYARLSAMGVIFRGMPTWPARGPSSVLLEDTCGNIIQLFQV